MVQNARAKFYFSIVLGLFFTLGASCLVIKNCSPEQQIKQALQGPIDDTGTMAEPLLKILDVMNVKHDGTLKNVVDLTQKAWLRPAGKERWEIEDIFEAKRTVLMPLFDEMGFVQAKIPVKQQYDYALLLGATIQRMRTRLAYMIVQWNAGVRFTKIVVLTGARERNNDIETEDVIIGKDSPDLAIRKDWKFTGVMPATENDMVKLVFEQTELPQDMLNVPVEFVATPMQPTENGGWRRPGSNDIIVEWLKSNPQPGSCLAFSNQPYAFFQDAAMRVVLPETFELETVGSSAVNVQNASVAIYLDNLARYIYSRYTYIERKNLEHKKSPDNK